MFSNSRLETNSNSTKALFSEVFLFRDDLRASRPSLTEEAIFADQSNGTQTSGR